MCYTPEYLDIILKDFSNPLPIMPLFIIQKHMHINNEHGTYFIDAAN